MTEKMPSSVSVGSRFSERLDALVFVWGDGHRLYRTMKKKAIARSSDADERRRRGASARASRRHRAAIAATPPAGGQQDEPAQREQLPDQEGVAVRVVIARVPSALAAPSARQRA